MQSTPQGDIVAGSDQEAVQSDPAMDARDEAGSEGCAVARDGRVSQDGVQALSQALLWAT